MVDQNTWTLDSMISFVSVVSEDNGDGVRNELDTYGITGWGWTDMVAFLHSSNMKCVERNETGLYRITYEENSEKLLDLLETISKIYDAEYAYFGRPIPSEKARRLDLGRGVPCSS